MPGAPIELLFAQKLASNEPKVRDKAVKKLSQWMRSRTSSKETDLTEDELLKLWKGLHYCFWMSDKMLVQEDLAEKISSMVHIFQSSPSTGNLFVRVGFQTLGREWFGIDRLRMDKFMMLVRRFLRQSLLMVANKHWEGIHEFVKLVDLNVINANKSVKDVKVSLGFQLHFSDVFLEELAKVGGENLTDETIRQFVQPFIRQLAHGREERLLEHIKVRIFQHLMRQSDLGIAHEDEDYADEVKDAVGDEEEEVEEDLEANNEKYQSDEEEEENKEEEEDEDNIKDPRAGRVDVTIPQLMVDYKKLADDLFAAGSDKEVSTKNRKLLYELTKQFRGLADGKYPLSPHFLANEEKEEVETINFKKEVNRKKNETVKELAKLMAERKEYRKTLKKNRNVNLDTGSKSEDHDSGLDNESPPSEEENDEADEIKYKLEEISKKKKKKSSLTKSTIALEGNGAQDEKIEKATKKKNLKNEALKRKMSDDSESTSPKKKKKKNKERSTESKLVLTENQEVKKSKYSDDSNEMEETSKSVNKKTKKRKTKSMGELAMKEEITTMVDLKKTEGEEVSAEKKTKKRKTKSLDGKQHELQINMEALPDGGISGFDPPTIKNKPLKGLVAPQFFKKAASKSANSSPAIPTSKKKLKSKVMSSEPRRSKRINFSLTSNKYQSIMEHSVSISESPDIPFLPERKPKQGLLKNKNDISIVSTPSPVGMKVVRKNTEINSKSKATKMMNRMMASDFF